MAVTFTNKAAKEMLGRISQQVTIDPRGMWVGTFHGLCNRFLRNHHELAGLPSNFQILDNNDQQSVLKRVLKSCNVDEKQYTPRTLQSGINKAKEQGLRAKDLSVNSLYDKIIQTVVRHL